MSRAPRSQAARRSWGTDDSDVSIMHIDMDAFFVSVELLRRPELRGLPVAVGGADRGVVSAASYEARAFGVNSAMPVGQAKRLCPQLIMLPASHGLYSEVSRRIMQILHDVTPLVEQVSVDEAFLDVAGARRLLGSPVEIARRIRASIRESEGVPASVGIAATKHVAKIASAHAKPDGLLLIPRASTLDFLHSLPVGALWGVGDRTRERLEKLGVETVADLAAFGQPRLEKVLGHAVGAHLYELAIGQDSRPIVTSREEKSVGREVTFFDNVADRRELEKVLLRQAHDAARRLRKMKMNARTVVLKIRFSDFTTISRSTTLAQPTDLAADIYAAAKRLFDAVTVPSPGLRLLGLRAEQLVDPREGIQLAFDSDERQDRAEHTLDLLRARFGAGSVMPASLLSTNDDAGRPGTSIGS